VNVLVAWGCVYWCDEVIEEETIGFPSAADAWLRGMGVDPAAFVTASVAETEESNRRWREPRAAPPVNDETIDEEAEIAVPGDPPTLRLRSPKEQWNGHLVFNDNKVFPSVRLHQRRLSWFGHDRAAFQHEDEGFAMNFYAPEMAFAARDRAGFPMRCLRGEVIVMNGEDGGIAFP